MPEDCSSRYLISNFRLLSRYLISNGTIKEVTMRISHTQTPEYVAHDKRRFIQKPIDI